MNIPRKALLSPIGHFILRLAKQADFDFFLWKVIGWKKHCEFGPNPVVHWTSPDGKEKIDRRDY